MGRRVSFVQRTAPGHIACIFRFDLWKQSLPDVGIRAVSGDEQVTFDSLTRGKFGRYPASIQGRQSKLRTRMVPIVRKAGPQRLVDRFPRGELLGHGLEYPVAAFRIEISPAAAGCYRKGWRTMLPKQAQNFSLNDDPRALHLHLAGNPLVDVHVTANATQRDAGGQAADRSAGNRDGKLVVGVPRHRAARSLPSAVTLEGVFGTTAFRMAATMTSVLRAPENSAWPFAKIVGTPERPPAYAAVARILTGSAPPLLSRNAST